MKFNRRISYLLKKYKYLHQDGLFPALEEINFEEYYLSPPPLPILS